MMKKVLYIQPFALDYYDDQKKLGNLLLIWPVYLDNYLKSKINNLHSELLYLPVERKIGKIDINSFKEKERFFSQMNNLISNTQLEIDEYTYICISGTTSYYYLSVKLIAEYFQENFPSAIIIFGGVHALASPQDFNYPNSPVDYAIIGEGETVLYRIIKQSYKKQENLKIITGRPIQNLDILPPLDLSLLDKYIDFFNDLSICLSRGCPFDCSFCMERNIATFTKNLKLWRTYSPKRAIRETKTMINYGIKFKIKNFGFVDPTFGVNKEWLNKFLKLWNFDKHIEGAWIETRFDVLNKELIKCLKKKKFFLWYGLESCSKKMLKIMNKHLEPEKFIAKFEKIFKIHKELDFLAMLNVIFNHPGETKETCYESFNKLKNIVEQDKNNNLLFSLRYYHHFPGTKVFNNFNYYNLKYGALAYFPNWWKKEELLKCGPYMVKASNSLELKELIEIYTSFYKELSITNINNLRQYKPNDFLARTIAFKKNVKSFERLGTILLNFIETYKLEN
ncbi:MAG: B12-binding domain-containing radical SAM protein [Promethearchaeota archaeon]